MLDKSIPNTSKKSTNAPTPEQVDYVRVHNLGLPPLYGHYGDGGTATDYLVDLDALDSLPEIPPILSRSDGETLIPEGKLSSIYGLPSTGKSWVAVMVAVSVARSGGRVLYWDFEDKPQTLLSRCNAIGFGVADGRQRIKWGRPSMADDPGALKQAALWVKGGDVPGLLIIDACESAGCPSDGSDVVPWYQGHVDPFRVDGISALLLDHIPKRAEDRPAGAIGSQHKLARLDGVALLVSGKPWTPRQSGNIALTVQKDRHGVLPVGIGKKAAAISGAFTDGVLRFSIDPPVAIETVKAEVITQRILDVLDANPDGVNGFKALRGLVQCKQTALDESLRQLESDGLIERQKIGQSYRIQKVRDTAGYARDTLDEIERKLRAQA